MKRGIRNQTTPYQALFLPFKRQNQLEFIYWAFFGNALDLILDALKSICDHFGRVFLRLRGDRAFVLDCSIRKEWPGHSECGVTTILGTIGYA